MELERRIIKSMDKIRPYIQRDGGDMQFFKIDENGIVIKEWRKVRVKNHIEEVLTYIREQ